MYKNQNIIITGATKGIGLAIAHKFAEYGANLALISRTQRDLETLKQSIDAAMASSNAGATCRIYSCDVSDSDQVEKTAANIVEDFKIIHGLLNNAGMQYSQRFLDTPLKIFERQMQINYLGAVHLTQKILPFMKNGCWVSFTASVVGYVGCFGYTGYAPTKHALIGFADSLRQEVELQGIQVCVLCPPDTLTPGYDEENLIKPAETVYLSQNIQAMNADKVAQAFFRGLRKKKFIINCSWTSEIIYRLHGLIPQLIHAITMKQLRRFKNQAIRQGD